MDLKGYRMLVKLLKELYDIDGKEVGISGKNIVYKTNNDTIFSFISKERMLTKCKRWVASHHSYSSCSGIGQYEWFTIFKNGVEIKMVKADTEFDAAIEACSWLIEEK